jgi:hypothetical protein
MMKHFNIPTAITLASVLSFAVGCGKEGTTSQARELATIESSNSFDSEIDTSENAPLPTIATEILVVDPLGNVTGPTPASEATAVSAPDHVVADADGNIRLTDSETQLETVISPEGVTVSSSGETTPPTESPASGTTISIDDSGGIVATDGDSETTAVVGQIEGWDDSSQVVETPDCGLAAAAGNGQNDRARRGEAFLMILRLNVGNHRSVHALAHDAFGNVRLCLRGAITP